MGDRKQAQDEEFQSFVIGRWPRLMRTAFLLTGEQHAAEDLVQSSLERAYVAWRKVSTADDPDAYVWRLMINAHARRHRRRLKEFLAPRTDTDLTPERPDTGDRIAQVLRYWEDLSETQTAQAMGCSVGAVKSNAAKGIAKLRAIPDLADTVTHGGRK
ncbi:SigE family RNA polymerase sigma factor [Streptomyces sp. Qhu-G9]|uniref:SigE family RNA polymerase sigma factor n=1 Tax=Streptomyces sp. Qhu-G9 TaxID=3452799 RepID=UPI0022AC5D35|nr:SigE family RNA polymerase sigma factor [Streptomyces aurantiacus]WAU79946.1 SigE family RNA polymerase sigma factor [Streptomyces aurantiacus]